MSGTLNNLSKYKYLSNVSPLKSEWISDVSYYYDERDNLLNKFHSNNIKYTIENLVKYFYTVIPLNARTNSEQYSQANISGH